MREEETLGIPVSQFMAGLDEPKRFADVQYSFCIHVILPLWSALARFFPDLEPLVANIEENAAFYNKERGH